MEHEGNDVLTERKVKINDYTLNKKNNRICGEYPFNI